MRVVFGGWKYIVRNLWFVLPFALIPAVFLALSLDASALSATVQAFFSGDPRMGFVDFFRALSLVRIDSWLGAVYSVCALVASVIFLTLLLVFVEKHMRIGKRTPAGIYSQLGTLALSVIGVVLCYLVAYELWAVILSAVLFAICSLPVTALVYLAYVVVLLAGVFVLLYLSTVLYLFLPCKQMTGFRTYDAFLYSYRLMTTVRWRLILSMLISYAAMAAVIIGCAVLPGYILRVAAIVLFLFLFASFGVRMETVYFETDKLDREDIIKSYREL